MAISDGAVGKQTGTKEAPPLLLVSRETYKKWKGEIKSETYALLLKYMSFHQKFDGTKPTESELVERALVRAFHEDVSFQKFVGNGGSKPSGTPSQLSAGEVGKGAVLEDVS